MKVKIADWGFNIKHSSGLRAFFRLNGYLQKCDIDYTIKVNKKETREAVKKANGKMHRTAAELFFIHRHIAEWLPLHGAFLLHSALIDVDGVGIAFAAHSGTGKSTHMLLWQKLLKDKLTVVNGDKPIIRFFDDCPNTPYAYGTPWNGKENLGSNTKTELRHICFIERATENSCTPIKKEEALAGIFNQVYMPTDPTSMTCTLELINRLLSNCKLWIIRCNTDISAAETAYNSIFGTQ